jgi:beta-ketoacyl-acyl-carrier-protein synthase II
MRRVVITGVGAISPIGLSAQDSWDNCVEGVSGVAPITLFDASEFLVQIACEVKGFDPKEHMSPANARRRDRCQQLAVAAGKQALLDSGLEINESNANRVGVVISSSIGGISSLDDSIRHMVTHGPRRVSPLTIPMLMPNGPSGLVAIEIGAQGPALSVSSACASSSDGIGLAWQQIRSGMCDAILAGGSEATICKIGIAAFDRLGAMSRRNDDFSMTPQPFDRNRDGLVMGEGSCVLMLEELTQAKERGANVLAELSGYGITGDAFHITAPHDQGAGGAKAMTQAMEIAEVNSSDIDYINAHGTATPLNDVSETLAIKTVFGQKAYEVPISSTKSMTGHMMGATGSLEAFFCIKAIQTQTSPPTIHYETPDPDCDLDYVPNHARDACINVAISNSFGFGGHNSVLLFKKYV